MSTAEAGASDAQADLDPSEDPPTKGAPSEAKAAPSAGAQATPTTPHGTEGALRAEVAGLRERLTRSRADYDNLQKRVARDSALERDRAKARALEGLIPVLELAEMAANQAEAHPGPLSEGMILLAREFRRALERDGLVPTGAVGEAFDRTRHEAIAQEEVPGIAPGCISRVIQSGYLLDGKVLRYAKVAVNPGKAP